HRVSPIPTRCRSTTLSDRGPPQSPSSGSPGCGKSHTDGGSFRNLTTPCRLALRFAHAQALFVNLAHELAVAEHANHSAPVFRRSFRFSRCQSGLQRLDSFGEGFQGQFVHLSPLPFGKFTQSSHSRFGYSTGWRSSRSALAMTSRLVPTSAAMAIQR